MVGVVEIAYVKDAFEDGFMAEQGTYVSIYGCAVVFDYVGHIFLYGISIRALAITPNSCSVISMR